MNEDERQRIIDQEHLRLLSIFYYVSAGMMALFACIPIIHLLMGVMFIVVGSTADAANGEAPPAIAGWIIVAIASLFIMIGWLIAFLKFLAGRFIHQRKHYIFCMAVAGFSCLSIPYGTVIGIMTFMVFSRHSIKSLFGRL